jgi:flavin reductase (DIM6/NTAB) family NADH-FMN oxidoreductase RutF
MKRSISAKALIVPTPVWVIGTYDHEGKPNVRTYYAVGDYLGKAFSIGKELS